MKASIGLAGVMTICAAFASASLAQAQEGASAPAASVTVPASRCPAFPADPSLPDGASARNARVMQDGDRAYQDWGRAMQSVLECRRTEAQEAQAASVLANQTAQTRVTEYNAAVERLNAIGQTWQAEAAEYNARTNRR